MNSPSPLAPTSIAWVGVGALGLLYSSRLALAGIKTHLLLRSDFHHASHHGIKVKSCDGDYLLPPDKFTPHRIPDTIPPVDVVIISTKTTSNAELPELLKPLVSPHTKLLTLQNGLGNEDLLAQHFPPENVFGGTAFVSVNRISPASIVHQHGGTLALGRYHMPRPPESDPELLSLVQLLQKTNFPILTPPTLAETRWEKQLWNVPFNGLGAAQVADTAILLSTQHGRKLLRDIMEEVIQVAQTQGVTLTGELADKKITYTINMGPYRTSMQLDREQGRPLEIDSIVSSVLRIAQKNGVSTPLLSLLELQLKSVDTGNSDRA